MKTKIHKKLIATITLIMAIITIAPPLTQAGQVQVHRNKKNLSIHPYNPDGKEVGPFETKWFNMFKEKDNETKTHLKTYSSMYSPQPVGDNHPPLKQVNGIEKISAPKTQHNHGWYHESTEDEYYYKAFMDSFVITLKKDALNNTDLNNIICKTPTPTDIIKSSCNTTINNAWGGTKITFNKQTGEIKWQFDIQDKGEAPVLYGNNPSLNTILKQITGDNNFDLSKDKYRQITPAVLLTTKNKTPLKAWSATTTSKALISYQAILKSSVDLNSPPNYGNLLGGACELGSQDYTHWCELPKDKIKTTNKIIGVEHKYGVDWFWEEIGTVATIWVPQQTPQKPQNYCTGLDITDPHLKYISTDKNGVKTYTMKSDKSNTEFTVKPTFKTGEDMPLDYKWESHTFKLYSNTNDTLKANLLSANPSNLISPSIQPSKNIIPSPQTKPVKQSFDIDNSLKITPADAIGTPTLNNPLKEITILGLFADDKNATDFANPYIDKNNTDKPLIDDRTTYYKGGSEGIVITVEGVDPTSNQYVGHGCKSQILLEQTPPPPGENQCIDLTIQQNEKDAPDTMKPTDEVKNLSVNINTDPSDYANELTINWLLKGEGEIQAHEVQQEGAKEVSAKYNEEDIDLLNPKDGTILTAEAEDTLTHKTWPACKDLLTFQNEENKCKNLNLSNDNKSLKAGESAKLNATPIDEQNNIIENVKWSEQGPGHFEAGPSQQYESTHFLFPTLHKLQQYMPEQSSQIIPPRLKGKTTQDSYICPIPEDDKPFIAPQQCDYTYIAGPNGGGSYTVEAEPNIGNVEACRETYTVPPTNNLKPYCQKLEFNKAKLDPNAENSLTALATFSDGKKHTITVNWTTNNAEVLGDNPQTGTNNTVKNTIKTEDESTITAQVTKTEDPEITDFQQCEATLSTATPPEKCEDIKLDYSKPNLICLDTYNYNGQIIWILGQKTKTTTGKNPCINKSEFNEKNYHIYAPGYTPECELTNTPQKEKNPPTLEKYVSALQETQNYKNVLTVSLDEKNPTTLKYKIVFTSNANNTTATIQDPSMQTGITGELLPHPEGYTPGHITYKPNSTKIKGINVCQLPPAVDEQHPAPEPYNPKNCYTPENPDIRNGIILKNLNAGQKVEITYEAEIKDSPIANPEICKEGKVCEEVYTNTAKADWEIKEESQPVYANGTLWDSARVQAFCQYILTRASGDIFLESDLNAGIDINKCSEYKSSTGIIVKPKNPSQNKINSTGAGEIQVVNIDHDLCKKQNDVSGNLSSDICEVKLTTATPWQKTVITNKIEENKTRISRWAPDYENGTTMNAITLNPNYKQKQVFHIKGNLTVNSKYTLKDGEGAKTFIIEDGDLIINNNIEYGNCDTGNCSVKDTASLAFIVLNGNIKIANNVTEMDGVYYVQKGDEGTGQLLSKENTGTYNKLLIKGSIFGDIEPLFEKRLYAGDPSKDEGGIVIRFDQRILENTPPGLAEIAPITQTQVAR